MRKIIVLIVFILFVSCNKKNKIDNEISNIAITIDIERFDLMFSETNTESLSELKRNYPFRLLDTLYKKFLQSQQRYKFH